MSHTVVVPLLNASPTILAPYVGKPTSASGSESAPTYTIKAVRMTGSVVTSLTLAEPDTITWTLNTPDEAEFHFPKNAYTYDQLAVLGNTDGEFEIQIYRNGDLIFWGPIVGLSGAGNDGKLTCHCAGVDWYLNRRFLDGTIANLLSNPDFESGTGSWSTAGGVTFTTDTDNFEVGIKSAQLVNATAGADAYISQTVTAGPNGVGLLLTASAWFYIDSITTAPYGNPWNRGIYLAGSYNGVFQTDNGYAIDTASPQGKWTKATATIWIPPNQTWSIEMRLYAPQGTIHWDDAKLVAMGSVSTAGLTRSTTAPVDISRIVKLMVQHAQSTTAGKSNVHITSHAETTGTAMAKHYQYVDHVQFDAALREFIERDDGLDYSLDITPTTRVFHTYANKRGTDRSGDVTLTYDVSDPSGSNVIDYRITQDGGRCITRQTVLGEDNGPTREQGERYDATNIGGTILQDVRQAPQGAQPASLDSIALERIVRFSPVPSVIEMDVPGSTGLIPTLKVGDFVALLINDGFVGGGNFDAVMRIQRLSLNCVTNVLTVTLSQDNG